MFATVTGHLPFRLPCLTCRGVQNDYKLPRVRCTGPWLLEGVVAGWRPAVAPVCPQRRTLTVALHRSLLPGWRLHLPAECFWKGAGG